MKILLVTATVLETEGFNFDAEFGADSFVEHIIAGVGKLAAYSAVWGALRRNNYDVIINAGTCGSTKFEVGTVLNPNVLFQGDLSSCPGIATEPFVLESGVLGVTCSTADVFYTNRGEFDEYDCHDMEAYAVQYATFGWNVDTRYVKLVSDNCRGTAHDWEKEVPALREQLAEEIKKEIRSFIPSYEYERIHSEKQ